MSRQMTCSMDSHCCTCMCLDESSSPAQLQLAQAVLAAYQANIQPMPAPTPAPTPAQQLAGMAGRKTA